jgi:hypothetical protein
VTESITTGFKLKINIRFVRLRFSKPPVQRPFESLRVTEGITTGFLIKGNKTLRLSD